MKNVFFAAGGTGGHLNPALNLANELSESAHVQFIGYNLSKNPYFDKRFLHYDISSYPLKKGLFAYAKAAFFYTLGFFQSGAVFFLNRPNLIVAFGAYHCVPALFAAIVFRIPIIIYEHNTYPGRVARFFSRFATKNFVVFEEAKRYLKEKAELCRPLIEQTESKEDPYAYFHLNPNKKTLLIFGGSQGARFVNQALKEALCNLKEQSENWQILHFIGFNCDLLEMEKTYEQLGFEYCVEPYCRRMDLALKVCDFAITRSGAQTILELILYQIPSILIPYPFAVEDHQLRNAQYFASTLQGGMVLVQNEHFNRNLQQALKLIMSEQKLATSKKKLSELFKKWQERVTVKEQVLHLLK